LKEIRRYLKASRGDVELTTNALKSSCSFRRHHRIDLLRDCFDTEISRETDDDIVAQKFRNMITEDLEHQPIWVHSGKDGHALLHLGRCASVRTSGEAFIYTLMYMIERALASSSEETIDVVLDISGIQPRYCPPNNSLKQLIYILQNHYPQRLRTLIVLDAPFWAHALYAVLSPFLDERTKKKLRLVRGESNKENVLGEFLECPDQLLNGQSSDPVAELTG